MKILKIVLAIVVLILWPLFWVKCWPRIWSKIKSLAKKGRKEITYINMPISSKDEDKIGISQYAKELKAAIGDGAQSIAVTSDFGGGKSSLIRHLETLYCRLFTKFCYINLWSQMYTQGHDTQELHKSFLYQLGSQISSQKGNYISRRLSKHYGVLGIKLPSFISTALSVLMCALIVIGFACTSLYETVSEYITFEFYTNNYEWLGQASFIIAGVIALFLLYRADIIFSSKNSETNRIIDEHELMDIYNTHICRAHLRHYIVVVEDLDRSEQNVVNQFIKELRRYYIPTKRRWFSWLFPGINRITFIVNIKEENQIADSKDDHLYGKAFDYVLNLKDIHVDNFDVILKKLLEDNRPYFKKEGIKAFDAKEEFISEFEWLIRGKNIGLRDIKTRLNTAILTYVNLCSKFNAKDISMPKCIASAYVTSACEKEHQNAKDFDFEEIIDRYVTNSGITAEDISSAFEKGEGALSAEFIDDIKTLVENGLIASDYKPYFFNYPVDSYLLDADQTKMVDLILYNTSVKDPQAFRELTDRVLAKGESVVTKSFDRLKRLSKPYPSCVFADHRLFEMAWTHDGNMMKNTLSQSFPYDESSVIRTAKFLSYVIGESILNHADRIEVLREILVENASAKAWILFRRQLIEKFPKEIIQFKSLFFGEVPLITKTEIESLRGNRYLPDLVNLQSAEINIDTIQEVHKNLLHGLASLEDEALSSTVLFYEKAYEAMGEEENATLTDAMLEFMKKEERIFETLETIVVENNDQADILDSYTELVNCAERNNALSPKTIDRVAALQISRGLSKEMCYKLYDAGYLDSFVINAVSTDISIVDFKDPSIAKAIALIDFSDTSDPMISEGLFSKIRARLLEVAQSYIVESYRDLFMFPYAIISAKELNQIDNTPLALQLIDFEQISGEQCEYIAQYLSRQNADIGPTYEILLCVCRVADKTAKRSLFLALNFEKLCYYRMAKKRKVDIVDRLSDVFDFEDIKEQIDFMRHTKCSYAPFELQIGQAIKESDFAEYKEVYSKYVKAVKKVENVTVHNLCAMKTTYPMPPHILEKIYSAKRYVYYVISKTLAEKRFEMEKDKLEVLLPSYERILLSDEDVWQRIKEFMAQNTDFIAYMAERKVYENTPEHTRLWFSYCLQSEELLLDLFEKYEDSFIITYLSQNKGFEKREAASCFLEGLKNHSSVAKSEQVYRQNYEKLVDGKLKSTFTKMYNAAQKA